MATRKIKVRYLKSHDYKISFANGIFGGINSNGLINANFYIDRMVIPDSETVEIDETGKRLSPPEIVRDGDAVREVQFGVIIDVKTAKRIAEWLTMKITEHESGK